jgi:hypothetical protein
MPVELIDHTPPSATRPLGNAEVVALLNKWLELAERGKLTFCALATLEPPRGAAIDFAGSIDMMEAIPEILDTLKGKIQERLREQLPPDQDPELDHSYYCYAVTTQPVGFDFGYQLIAAEMDRRRANAPGPLKIGFWAGGTGQYGINTLYRKTMFENVVKPMLELVGAVQDDVALRGHRGGFRLLDITKAARAGEEVPRFKASRKATMTVASWFLNNEKPITITLRETNAYPHRNSNREAWLKFAKDLEAAGETVVIVRDTAKAAEPLEGFSTCPAASTSLDLRHALYEHAKLNFFGSNGCSACGWFGTAPFLQFINLQEGSSYFPDTRWWWRDVAGIDGGEQMPWFSSQQRIVWELDTYDNICKAWEAFRASL